MNIIIIIIIIIIMGTFMVFVIYITKNVLQ